MYTDDPTRDAAMYYEEQEETAHERIAKAPECCICHRKIIDGYAYVLNKYENVFAHGKCVKNEMKKINSILADEVEERLWDNLTDAEKL